MGPTLLILIINKILAHFTSFLLHFFFLQNYVRAHDYLELEHGTAGVS